MDKSLNIFKITVLFVSAFIMKVGISQDALIQNSLTSIPSDLVLTSDTGRISWGERATIKLKLGLEVGEESTGWPVWEDTIPGGFEILEISNIDTILPLEDSPSEWDFIIEQSWVVTAWDSGYLIIPPIEIGDDKTSPIMIQVIPTRTVGSPELKPAADIVSIEWTFTDRLKKAAPWILGVIGIAILGLLYIYVVKKIMSKKIVDLEKVAEVIPPHITALEKLRLLEERKVWTKGEAKSFHVQLSEIIRTYLDSRFKISSLESTTREVAQMINSLDISQSDKSNLIMALQLGDKIKFAKYRAESEDHTRVLSTCIAFVENTMETSET
ncbi:MAG: hypothetical protein COA49_06325 [Bacteroidetes bacterium]|nr:MAG: hypothetical protein COA49_06325 [Bacteroidota bacterium]